VTFVSEYPKRQQRKLVVRWAVSILLLILILADILAITYGYAQGKLTGVVYGAFPALLLLVSGSVIVSLRETFFARICPILEKRVPGGNPYEDAPAARDFPRVHKGKAIARSYRTLVRIAKDRAIQTLAEFGQVDVYDKNIQYYDTQPAIEAVEDLLSCLADPSIAVRNKTDVINELRGVLEVLKEAEQTETKFCFAILSS